MGFSRQEYWSGLPFLSPEDLPDPAFELESPARIGGFFTTDAPWEAHALNVRPTFWSPGASGGSPPPEAASQAGATPGLPCSPTELAVPTEASHPWDCVQAPGAPFWTSELAGRLP